MGAPMTTLDKLRPILTRQNAIISCLFRSVREVGSFMSFFTIKLACLGPYSAASLARSEDVPLSSAWRLLTSFKIYGGVLRPRRLMPSVRAARYLTSRSLEVWFRHKSLYAAAGGQVFGWVRRYTVVLFVRGLRATTRHKETDMSSSPWLILSQPKEQR